VKGMERTVGEVERGWSGHLDGRGYAWWGCDERSCISQVERLGELVQGRRTQSPGDRRFRQ